MKTFNERNFYYSVDNLREELLSLKRSELIGEIISKLDLMRLTYDGNYPIEKVYTVVMIHHLDHQKIITMFHGLKEYIEEYGHYEKN